MAWLTVDMDGTEKIHSKGPKKEGNEWVSEGQIVLPDGSIYKMIEVELQWSWPAWLFTKIPERGILEPFDMVEYTPTGEWGIVKKVDLEGAWVLFKIQSTSHKCRYEDLRKL